MIISYKGKPANIPVFSIMMYTQKHQWECLASIDQSVSIYLWRLRSGTNARQTTGTPPPPPPLSTSHLLLLSERRRTSRNIQPRICTFCWHRSIRSTHWTSNSTVTTKCRTPEMVSTTTPVTTKTTISTGTMGIDTGQRCPLWWAQTQDPKRG